MRHSVKERQDSDRDTPDGPATAIVSVALYGGKTGRGGSVECQEKANVGAQLQKG